MPRLSVLNHPVHPILQAIPASLLPASTTFDALARLGVDEEGLRKAGHYTLVFGLVGAVGAAATGVLDFYEIENRPVRRLALYHGLTNAALVGSSGYLGGELVYEHGVRVGEDHDGIPGAS